MLSRLTRKTTVQRRLCVSLLTFFSTAASDAMARQRALQGRRAFPSRVLLAGVLGAGAVFLSGLLPSRAASLAAGDVVLYASQARIVGTKWKLESDSTAAGGRRLRVPDAGAPKVTTSALITPTDYIEFSFTAEANKDYHLWIRGKADSNYFGNDSAFVQFDKTLDASNAPAYRIGTASAIVDILEDCATAGVQGWGWQDNSNYECVTIPAAPLRHKRHADDPDSSREDGLSIDQIVLSPATYLWTTPGGIKERQHDSPAGRGDQPSPTFKVAFYNIRGGQGVIRCRDMRLYSSWAITARIRPSRSMRGENRLFSTS